MTDKQAQSSPELQSGEAGSAGTAPETSESGKHNRRQRQREIGGRKGPEPTRFGDWEKDGRCVDF